MGRSADRPLTILKIAPTSFFSDYGCHVRIYEESLALQKIGHRVIICTYPTGKSPDGLDIRRSLNSPWRNRIQVGSSLHKLYYDGLLGLKCAAEAFRVRPDLIHAHLHEGAFIGYPISRLGRVPLVFDFQGSLTSEMLDHNFLHRGSVFLRPLRVLEGLIDRMADVVITSSRNAANILIRDFHYPPQKVFTISDCVDHNFFRPCWEAGDGDQIQADKDRLSIPSQAKVVLYLGLLAEYQGIGKLLEAAAILRGRGLDVHFLVMGFPGEDYYCLRAQELGVAHCVTFTGRIPYEEAPRYMRLGDIAVSPKISETEGNGKLLNYMAVGLPTVAFRTPVAQEILGDLGVYAEVGNSTSLAGAIEGLLIDEEKARALSRMLRERAVREFSWETAGQRIANIYRMVA